MRFGILMCQIDIYGDDGDVAKQLSYCQMRDPPRNPAFQSVSMSKFMSSRALSWAQSSLDRHVDALQLQLCPHGLLAGLAIVNNTANSRAEHTLGPSMPLSPNCTSNNCFAAHAV